MTCLMRTMRQPGFVPPNGHNPAHPLPVMPAAPSLLPAGPSLSCPQAPSLSCLHAPSLSCPQAPSVIPAGFSGNPVKTVLLQESIGSHTPSGKASMTTEWRAPWCRTVNEGNIQQEKTMDSRLPTSGMTEGEPRE